MKLNDPYAVSLFVKQISVRESLTEELLFANHKSILVVQKSSTLQCLVKGNVIIHWQPYIHRLLFDFYCSLRPHFPERPVVSLPVKKNNLQLDINDDFIFYHSHGDL